MTDQTVLSIESGTSYLSLGLLAGGRSFVRVLEVGRTAAERLPAELEALYAEAAVAMRADVIVVGTGPGSYTGLRVGASYALGLGRAWSVPVLGVPTLEALTGGAVTGWAVADRAAPDGVVAVSMDARKEHVYGAVYRLTDGVVSETVRPAAKYALSDFGALASGLPWHRDGAPDPLLLAANGLHHGQREWELSYL
ncbi:tRNA (adenosine(37)-N6)-threonylcarbamoyltransferase complex dimerization subunit type 1 TsaB [Deinococcus altitudinis]|uniref:tRNA (adenosine(37)-N6)-threonylcarbamoyltransferase complex dimerization subunit type 1 TsaB n=1 Tax=Deinococcus altitudinis TaxID=468914 RepID=UPI003891859D